MCWICKNCANGQNLRFAFIVDERRYQSVGNKHRWAGRCQTSGITDGTSRPFILPENTPHICHLLCHLMRYVETNFSCGDIAVRFVVCRLAIIPIKSITTTWNTLFCCKICLVANYACLYREKLNQILPMCKKWQIWGMPWGSKYYPLKSNWGPFNAD